MKTQVKQYGGSVVIILDPIFVKYHNIKVGDWLDLSDIVVEKNKEKKEK